MAAVVSSEIPPVNTFLSEYTTLGSICDPPHYTLYAPLFICTHSGLILLGFSFSNVKLAEITLDQPEELGNNKE